MDTKKNDQNVKESVSRSQSIIATFGQNKIIFRFLQYLILVPAFVAHYLLFHNEGGYTSLNKLELQGIRKVLLPSVTVCWESPDLKQDNTSLKDECPFDIKIVHRSVARKETFDVSKLEVVAVFTLFRRAQVGEKHGMSSIPGIVTKTRQFMFRPCVLINLNNYLSQVQDEGFGLITLVLRPTYARRDVANGFQKYGVKPNSGFPYFVEQYSLPALKLSSANFLFESERRFRHNHAIGMTMKNIKMQQRKKKCKTNELSTSYLKFKCARDMLRLTHNITKILGKCMTGNKKLFKCFWSCVTKKGWPTTTLGLNVVTEKMFGRLTRCIKSSDRCLLRNVCEFWQVDKTISKHYYSGIGQKGIFRISLFSKHNSFLQIKEQKTKNLLPTRLSLIGGTLGIYTAASLLSICSLFKKIFFNLAKKIGLSLFEKFGILNGGWIYKALVDTGSSRTESGLHKFALSFSAIPPGFSQFLQSRNISTRLFWVLVTTLCYATSGVFVALTEKQMFASEQTRISIKTVANNSKNTIRYAICPVTNIDQQHNHNTGRDVGLHPCMFDIVEYGFTLSSQTRGRISVHSSMCSKTRQATFGERIFLHILTPKTCGIAFFLVNILSLKTRGETGLKFRTNVLTVPASLNYIVSVDLNREIFLYENQNTHFMFLYLKDFRATSFGKSHFSPSHYQTKVQILNALPTTRIAFVRFERKWPLIDKISIWAGWISFVAGITLFEILQFVMVMLLHLYRRKQRRTFQTHHEPHLNVRPMFSLQTLGPAQCESSKYNNRLECGFIKSAQKSVKSTKVNWNIVSMTVIMIFGGKFLFLLQEDAKRMKQEEGLQVSVLPALDRPAQISVWLDNPKMCNLVLLSKSHQIKAINKVHNDFYANVYTRMRYRNKKPVKVTLQEWKAGRNDKEKRITMGNLTLPCKISDRGSLRKGVSQYRYFPMPLITVTLPKKILKREFLGESIVIGNRRANNIVHVWVHAFSKTKNKLPVFQSSQREVFFPDKVTTYVNVKHEVISEAKHRRLQIPTLENCTEDAMLDEYECTDQCLKENKDSLDFWQCSKRCIDASVKCETDILDVRFMPISLRLGEHKTGTHTGRPIPDFSVETFYDPRNTIRYSKVTRTLDVLEELGIVCGAISLIAGVSVMQIIISCVKAYENVWKRRGHNSIEAAFSNPAPRRMSL